MSAPSSPRARALRWLLAGAAILLGPGTALAQHGGHGGHGGGHPHGSFPHGSHWDGGHIHGGGSYRLGPGRWAYRPGHAVHGFSRPDFVRWSGGHWRQTCWGGRCGWWWFTGGLWYFYAAPVYPYPPVVSSITYVPPVYAPAATPGPASLAPQPTFSYYCDDPPGYYPAVPQCRTPWHESVTPVEPPPPADKP
ncbi:hypothetical protein [Alicycliphilus denitrificans]|uniref:Proline-rich region n=1 Tax=Alicycliphilus denitrificans (strain DSM 14773 / CIP 107495 / K601) TaxID=596154 RepID=F4G5P7_ALIDK|nr:hypothetical protein [Alicycliphilus denitrificans]AEB85304.1 hypothetical protein Alide2_2957 [Alicycliphilus denitrificans K601]